MSAAIRTELARKLSRILGGSVVIKSSHLLRAYTTFVGLGVRSGDELINAYLELMTSDRYPKNTLIRLSRQASPEDVEDVARAFRQYSLEEFLRFIVPDLVANSFELISLWQSELHSDILLLAHVIIQLRKLMYLGGEKTQRRTRRSLGRTRRFRTILLWSDFISDTASKLVTQHSCLRKNSLTVSTAILTSTPLAVMNCLSSRSVTRKRRLSCSSTF